MPGRDFAGLVEAGPFAWIGAEVWGTGGDTGFTRDGTHAEMMAVPDSTDPDRGASIRTDGGVATVTVTLAEPVSGVGSESVADTVMV